MRTINFQGFDFLFDKSDTLIGILDEGEVIRYELQSDLENRFTGNELIDFLEGDNNLVYRNNFADWLEKYNNFTA